MEKCANCDRDIGELEEPHLFNGRVVCQECDERLRRPRGDASLPREFAARGGSATLVGRPEQAVSAADGPDGRQRTGPGPMQHVAVQVNVANGDRVLSVFTIFAFLFGGVAILVAWIPIVGIFAIPAASAGLLCAVVGLIRDKSRGRTAKLAIGAGALCLLDIVIIAVITVATAHAINKAAQEQQARNNAALRSVQIRANNP